TLRYRGDGWPGDFVAEDREGHRGSVSYDDSWGKTLGPTVQWRCKLCADGVGESADIVAADLWESDSRGYPVFEDRPGISALIARTARGRAEILRAIEAGVIQVETSSLAEVVA